LFTGPLSVFSAGNRLFSSVFLFTVVFMFLYTIHAVSFVQYTLEKRLSSCQNVCFCFCVEIDMVTSNYSEHKTTYLWSMRSPRGGELSLSACPGVGNRPPRKKKIANPWGCARGGWYQVELNPALLRVPVTCLSKFAYLGVLCRHPLNKCNHPY